ncbi:MAG: SDR family oxidoreductase, partial [Alicyclobacillus sp.]|nr:SDR family oxidoreductase [Alicyclobacillus sp.]
ITVNAVAPGLIATDMTAELKGDLVDKMVEQIPLGAVGQPVHVAKAVAFFASPDAGYITGQVLHVDGGMAM